MEAGSSEKAVEQVWEVDLHPGAVREMEAIGVDADRKAIAHVIEKLEVEGLFLGRPHQRAVRGKGGSGLRELRPRGGRSRWRLIYGRTGESQFTILSVGPEVEVSRAGYRRAVRDGKRRLAGIGERRLN
jgi:hypothetical protein